MTTSLLSITLAQASSPSGEGIIDMFLSVGLVGKVVFGILALFSLASWTIMILKYLHLGKAERHSNRFSEVFRTSRKFSEVSSAAGEHVASPLVGLFQAGYAEIDAQVKAQQGDGDRSEKYRIKSLMSLERSLRRALSVELQMLSKGTPFLATTAAAAPFIGLFGTVWGIMIAFNDIGLSGSASLVAVAPGIAEALINTTAGLAAAIPALVGYNYFGTRLRLVRFQMDDFVLEFLNLAERNFT